MDSSGSSEIRIIKRKKGHAGHHGGAWKVAFADFMTALMAFFLVMWISNQSTTIKQAVAAYFKDPIGFKEAVAKGNAPFAISESTIGGDAANSVNGSSSNTTVDVEKLTTTKQQLENLIGNTPEFKELKNYIDIRMTPEGLQIELLEARQSLFFDSGCAVIKPKTRLLLTKIGKELSKLSNKVVIEGHTDSRPLRRTDGYTNWELSADRANSARRIMELGGMKHGQIVQVRGLADNKLRDPKNPNDYINRRVSIILLYNRIANLKPQNIKKGLISIPEIKKHSSTGKEAASSNDDKAIGSVITDEEKAAALRSKKERASGHSESSNESDKVINVSDDGVLLDVKNSDGIIRKKDR